MATLSRDYSENCNYDVVRPCLVSLNPELKSKPPQELCGVAIAFHNGSGNSVADGIWTAANTDRWPVPRSASIWVPGKCQSAIR